MSLLCRIIGTCIVLCLVRHTSAKRYSLSVLYNFTGSDLMYKEKISVKDMSFAYLLCDKSNDEEKSCTITREYHSFTCARKKVSCDLSLKYRDKDSQRKVGILGRNKVVILSSETIPYRGLYFKLTVVHFPSCEMNTTSIAIPSQEKPLDLRNDVTLMVYDNEAFELAFRSEVLCSRRFCSVTYDGNGEKIDGPRGLFSNEAAGFAPYIDPVSCHAPNNEYLLFNPKRNNERLYKVKNGGIKLVTELDGINAFGLGTNDNLLSYCYQTTFNYYANCTQTDQDIRTISESSPNIGRVIFGFSMYNLRSGGFLIATRTMRNKLYAIKKIDINGKIVGAVEYTGFKCERQNHIPYAQFFEMGGNKICVSMLCSEGHDNADHNSGYFEWACNCFTEKDFYL